MTVPHAVPHATPLHSVPHRPVLPPALPRAWRDDALQLGRPPGPALLLLDAAQHRALLTGLDGTRTREQLSAELPASAGVLDALAGAGLLLDADDLRPPGLDRHERDRLAPDLASLSLVHGPGTPAALLSRRAARVVVHGAGRVGAPLAALLSAAGVGTVDVRDDQPARAADLGVGGLAPADVGRPRGTAAADRIRSVGSVRAPVVVVLADDALRDDPTAAGLARAGLPHLVAQVEDRTGVVGPLVLPGTTACLRCVALTRTVLDPGWPQVADQLDRARSSVACDGVLATAVAAQAALQVLELVEGGTPATVGGSLELVLPGWAWRRRTWPQHPGCPCAWTQAAA